MRTSIIAICLFLSSTQSLATEVSGVFIDAESKAENGEILVLNGAGLREIFWVDVYVGSLYLPTASNDVAEILSKPEPWRIQLDFVYKEVAQKKLLDSWREGFEKNQSADTLQQLQTVWQPSTVFLTVAQSPKISSGLITNPALVPA